MLGRQSNQSLNSLILVRFPAPLLMNIISTKVHVQSWMRQPDYEVNFQMYLAQYGYLSPSVRNPSSGHIMDESSWKKAIAEFQSFAGLNTTGKLIISLVFKIILKIKLQVP